MNRFERLVEDLRNGLPGVGIETDPSERPTGSWWLDARLGEHKVVVEWRPAIGFGVTSRHSDPDSSPWDGFGQGPDEVYVNAEDALARIVEVLEKGERTRPPSEMALRKLREARRISQVELAELMGIRQATVSKMERQADMNVSTLRRMIAALGGTLEIQARFQDRMVTIDLDQGDDTE